MTRAMRSNVPMPERRGWNTATAHQYPTGVVFSPDRREAQRHSIRLYGTQPYSSHPDAAPPRLLFGYSCLDEQDAIDGGGRLVPLIIRDGVRVQTVRRAAQEPLGKPSVARAKKDLFRCRISPPEDQFPMEV